MVPPAWRGIPIPSFVSDPSPENACCPRSWFGSCESRPEAYSVAIACAALVTSTVGKLWLLEVGTGDKRLPSAIRGSIDRMQAPQGPCSPASRCLSHCLRRRRGHQVAVGMRPWRFRVAQQLAADQRRPRGVDAVQEGPYIMVSRYVRSPPSVASPKGCSGARDCRSRGAIDCSISTELCNFAHFLALPLNSRNPDAMRRSLPWPRAYWGDISLLAEILPWRTSLPSLISATAVVLLLGKEVENS